jgi:hypothetical protein
MQMFYQDKHSNLVWLVSATMAKKKKLMSLTTGHLQQEGETLGDPEDSRTQCYKTFYLRNSQLFVKH